MANFYLLFGLLVPTPNMTYLGREIINPQDTYTYVSYIEQGREGRVFFEDLYNPIKQVPSLFRPSYLFLGELSNLTQIQSIVMYHLGRIVFSILFFVTLYAFLGLFFKTEKRRLFTFAFVLTSSGLGYILGTFLPKVTDRWIPESITFLSLGQAPHFPLSQALMLSVFLFLIYGWVTSKKIFYVLSALSVVFLSFEHPYNIPVVILTIVLAAGYMFFSKKELRADSRRNIFWGATAIILTALAAFIYQAYFVFKNPVLSNWNRQNIIPSPNILYFALGYGFILPFSAIGFIENVKSKRPETILVISWVVATVILLYSPIPFQSRFSEGLHIPISILAVFGIIEVGKKAARLIPQRSARSVIGSVSVFILLASSLGSFGNVVGNVSAEAKDTRSSYFYHLLRQDYKAMLWIRENTSPDSVILANLFYGNLLPGISGRKVYVGHGVQTPHMEQKIKQSDRFLETKNIGKEYAFLKNNNITLIYIGENDSLLSTGFEPDKKAYLVKIYDQYNVKIYHVR